MTIRHLTLFSFLLVVFISSCSPDSEDLSPRLTEYNESVVDYFQEVALGFEFGNASNITRRWENDMRVFMGGQISPELLVETERIIDEINELSTTGFKVELVADSLQSNYYVFLGSGASYARIYPSMENLVGSNFGLFTIFWDGSNRLFNGHMYVDIFRADTIEQKHLLREELTQSLGLARDSDLYAESIFQQSFSTKTTDYASIDRDVIRLLYHPGMRLGLSRLDVENVLRDILLAEQ